MSASRRRDDYIAAALDLLDEHGPAAQHLGVSASAACRATGWHRSSLYRHFPTVGELNDVVAVWFGAVESDWRATLREQAPTEAMRVALARSLPDATYHPGPWIRATVAGWDDHHPARRAVADAERCRQAVLADWLEAHLRAHRRQPVRGIDLPTIALGVAALVEGHGILHHVDRWGPEGEAERQRLLDRVGRLVDDLTEPGRGRLTLRTSGDAEGQIAPSAPTFPASAVVHLRRLGTDVDDLLDRRGRPARLVHLGRLARRLGVQERRLYAMWPTADAMNGDLARAVIEREQQRTHALLDSMFELGANDDFTDFDELMTHQAADAVRGPSTRRGNVFALLSGLTHPAHRELVADLLDRWTCELRTAFLAGQALLRLYRRPDVTADELTVTLREGILGTQRIALLLPEVLDATVHNGWREVAAIGWLPVAMVRSTATQTPPGLDAMAVRLTG